MHGTLRNVHFWVPSNFTSTWTSYIFTVHHSVQIDPRLGVAIVSKTPDVESGGSLECRNSELSYATQENCVSSCPDPFDMLGDHPELWAKYTLSFPSCF